MKRGRVKAVSAKRLAEDDARWDCRMEVMRRASYRCEAPDGAFGMSHGGSLDVDEKAGRNVYPGGHLDPDACQLLCRQHHSAKHRYPDEARELGLRIDSWNMTGVPSKIVPRPEMQ
jgi:hypothetical protein